MKQNSVLSEGEISRKAGAIKTLALGFFGTMVLGEIIVIVLWRLNPSFPVIPLTLVFVAGILIALISYWLVKVDRVKTAGYFFIISLLIDSTVITSLFGGFLGPMAITYLFSILAAGMVIGINAGFFIATLAAIFYLTMMGLERTGLIPQLIPPENQGFVLPYLTVVVRVVLFYLIAFMSWFAASGLHRALQNVRRYAAELQTTNEKLVASEEELRASNEELQATEEELRASNEELQAANEELRDAQEQLVRSERLAAVGQLAGGVGHELRNPLGAIKNAVYYIRGKLTASELAEQAPRVMEFLDIVDDEINASNKIINDLLGFSRVGKPAVTPTTMSKVIKDTLARLAIPENIELNENLGSDAKEIAVDPGQIQQVLINVITNAVQAMPEGGKLTVGTREKNGFQEIDITDTGSGIAGEVKGKIFEPLFTTRAKGIGLGLAVSKSIIDRHGGQIEVKSVAGKGTTFTIKLPLGTPVQEGSIEK